MPKPHLSSLAPALLITLTATTTTATQPDPATLQRALDFTRLYEQHAPTIDPTSTRAAPDATVNVGRGNVPLYIPTAYDPTNQTPLIVLLHGYQNNGDEIDAYFQFSPFVDSYNFILATPTGQRNFLNQEYWNATDACCDLFNNNPDDSAYLRALVEEIRLLYNINPRRIHFAGHSNGGFMSYRMACDHADIVASIASLAGATWANPNNCTPTEPVSILQIHGTDDNIINYNGGNVILGGFQPGAVFTAESWADYNACDITPTPGPGPLDLATNIPGPDTTTNEYITNCDPAGSARLWTIPNGPHSPGLTTTFTTNVLDFLFAHPKPCTGDTNNDNAITPLDISTVLANFGSTTPNGPTNGDLNNDGQVTPLDISTVLTAFGTTCP